MTYCKYCKREYKCYDTHITTNKHFIRKISTKEVHFADSVKIRQMLDLQLITGVYAERSASRRYSECTTTLISQKWRSGIVIV